MTHVLYKDHYAREAGCQHGDSQHDKRCSSTFAVFVSGRLFCESAFAGLRSSEAAYPDGAKDLEMTQHRFGLQISGDQLGSITAKVEVPYCAHQGIDPSHQPKSNQQNPLKVQGLLHGGPEGGQGASRWP